MNAECRMQNAEWADLGAIGMQRIRQIGDYSLSGTISANWTIILCPAPSRVILSPTGRSLAPANGGEDLLLEGGQTKKQI